MTIAIVCWLKNLCHNGLLSPLFNPLQARSSKPFWTRDAGVWPGVKGKSDIAERRARGGDESARRRGGRCERDERGERSVMGEGSKVLMLLHQRIRLHQHVLL